MGESQGAFVLQFSTQGARLTWGREAQALRFTQGEIKLVLLGGMSGLHGFAGVCEEVGEGRGATADSRGSGPCAGDHRGGAAGHGEQKGRTGRNACSTGEQSGAAVCYTDWIS